MTPRTIYLSKLLGLYYVAVALCILIRGQAAAEMITSLLRDPGLMLVSSLLTLMGGLALILAHNRWSGGAPAVVVTVIGWLALAKSLVHLLLPSVAEQYVRIVAHPAWVRGCMVFALLLGAYLAVSGFRAKGVASSQG